jgi:oxalate decarboxylase/phosphoglucose isomerase-like protein (cupin superfamily)
MALSDCTIKVTNPDGTTRDVMNKAGTAMAVPTTASHIAHNVGSTDCQAVFVERK